VASSDGCARVGRWFRRAWIAAAQREAGPKGKDHQHTGSMELTEDQTLAIEVRRGKEREWRACLDDLHRAA